MLKVMIIYIRRFCLLAALLLAGFIPLYSQGGFEMPPVEKFISKWQGSGASELGSSQSFINELCDLLEVERPNSPRPALTDNTYLFEKSVPYVDSKGHNSSLRIDCYKRGFFIWESKQGADKKDVKGKGEYKTGTFLRNTKAWDVGMVKAYEQALNYTKLLSPEEGTPPFIFVSDIGYAIEIYSDFKGLGVYTPYPNARENRIALEDIRKPEVKKLLRTIWTDPMSLDASRENEKVTNEIGIKLGELAKSLEDSGYSAEDVSGFLMKCIFTMYAEDCGLLPNNSFKNMLDKASPKTFSKLVDNLWRSMKTGGVSDALGVKILAFGGCLFDDIKTLPLREVQLDLLRESAAANWASVEISIFGTILERALKQEERHKLGAHYTPPAYVERLIIPTFVDDLRTQWRSTVLRANGFVKKSELKAAASEIENFHKTLSETMLLDPSCGSGNFLTTSMKMMKDIEAEVIDALLQLGQTDFDIAKRGYSVSPKQFKGIEVTPKGSEISELVLWIAYLQSHFKAYGQVNPPEPIFNKSKSIECRDAVLTFDKDGKPCQASAWPKADYIIGNPPFMGNFKMRTAFGDNYVEALRSVYPEVPKSVDYVMYWWYRSAELVKEGKAKRFGLITTNSIKQIQNRKVIEEFLEGEQPLSIVYAIADHPWIGEDGAGVRIAMTVGEQGHKSGVLGKVISEKQGDGIVDIVLATREGMINSNLTIGADITQAKMLKSNYKMSYRGVTLHGSGFIVSKDEAKYLGLGAERGLENHIVEYRNGRDLVDAPRNVMVIDLYGLNIAEVQNKFPKVYEWVYEKVKPERDKNRDESIKKHWWIFGRPRPEMRDALKGLDRYIATSRTTNHRCFVFLDKRILPDGALAVIASDDAYVLGVLASHIHSVWASVAGGTLVKAPVYNNTTCFDKFPFPDANEKQKSQIRFMGEKINSDRDNSGVQKELDIAVFDAYGWDVNLSDEEIISKLLKLNQERASEEEKGNIKWLRPDFQKNN